MASTTLGASPPRESRQSSWEPCGAAAGAKDLADVPRRCCVTWRKRGAGEAWGSQQKDGGMIGSLIGSL